MEGSTGERRGKPLLAAYVAGVVIVLLSVTAIWIKHSSLLYIGRDADLGLWITKAYGVWAYPLDVTAMNPLQGMVSMLVAINPYFNPGAWVFETGWPHELKLIASQLVYLLEVTASTVVLGLALGFSRPFSFAASMWLVLLLFPPFNYIFGLQGWLATAPIYGHTLAISNLLLVALTRIGVHRPGDETTFKRSLAINGALTACILLLIFASLMAAPFYNAGMFIGSIVAAAMIVFSSSSGAQLLWRLACGAILLVCCYFLGLFDFYVGAKAYSARFGGASVYWPAGPRAFLCETGIACDRLAGWPLATTGSYWLHLFALLGSVAAAAGGRGQLSRLGVWFAGTWLALLTWWSVTSFGIVPIPSFSPVYFFLMLYPFVAFFGLYGMSSALARPWRRAARPTQRDGAEIAFVGGIAGAFAVLVALYGVTMDDARALIGRSKARPPGIITDIVRREVGLHPGEPYRGAVATVLGAPSGTLRRALGLSPTGPLDPADYAAVLALAAESGSSHDLLDLWWLDIPTLSEYGQGVSPPLMYYVLRFLSAPTESSTINYAVPRQIDIDVLRAMGMRFVITDAELEGPLVSRVVALPLKLGATIFLYELARPNLGTYSPTIVRAFDAGTFARRVAQDARVLEREAFVAGPPTTMRLSPATRAGVVFEKGAIHISAASNGASAVLLPVQFSHCYRLDGAVDNVRVMRANAIHTLLIFERELDVRLRWEYGFVRNNKCRLRDAEDVKGLALW